MYNLAKKYGYVDNSRVRKIIAPQMERACQRILGTENFYYPPPKVYFCTMPKVCIQMKLFLVTITNHIFFYQAIVSFIFKNKGKIGR